LHTSIVEDCVFKGAVLKEGLCWSDVLKITVLKQGFLKLHIFYFYVDKPACKVKKNDCSTNTQPCNYFFLNECLISDCKDRVTKDIYFK